MNLKEIGNAIIDFIIAKPKVEGKAHITDKDIEGLDKDLELERGYKEGKIASLEQSKKQLEEMLNKGKEVNVAKVLQKQQRAIFYKQFQQAFSMRKFIGMLLKNNQKFKLMSFDDKKNFGNFYDVIIRTDGRLSILAENDKGEVEPLITGRDASQIFRNVGGLSNTAILGHFNINYDAKGRYADNVEELDVPAIITDKNGKSFQTQIHKKKFIEAMIEKDEQINHLYGLLETYEQALNEMMANENVMAIREKISENRAGKYASVLSDNTQNTLQIESNMLDMSKEILRKSYLQSMNEQKVEILESSRKEMENKLSSFLNKQGIDIAEENFGRLLSYIIEMAKELPKAQIMPEIIPDKTKLEKKF